MIRPYAASCIECEKNAYIVECLLMADERAEKMPHMFVLYCIYIMLWTIPSNIRRSSTCWRKHTGETSTNANPNKSSPVVGIELRAVTCTDSDSWVPRFLWSSLSDM